MEKTVQNIPFLRIVIAFSLGICLESIWPTTKSNFILVAIIILLTIVFIINKIYKYNLQTTFGIIITIIFILTGSFCYSKYNNKPVFFDDGIFEATVLELPQEKTNSYQTVVRVNSFIKNNTVFPTDEQIIVYFSKEIDTKNLNSGSVVLFNTSPRQIKNFGNPYEFNYKQYLERKKIYRQVYLNDRSWTKTGYYKNPLTTIAEKTRQKLLAIYQNLPIEENELEILSALTLGYKRDLDPETKRVFSSAGAMHVLAVSGLHVGIIFWTILLMFGYLRKQKLGRIIFAAISIISLWFYAFITGLSPSVMRAATMFTIFILGENLQRRSSIYNSLAASAFILLLINPNNLFETGFQLSYSAVFGIVYLQPKIRSVINIKKKIPLFFWDLLCVSIAAQITTIPLTLYYFGQFPVYFWLTNIIIIPAIMLLIPLGILLLFVSVIPVLANFIAAFINSIIKSIFFLLTNIEQLPISVLNTNISRTQQILLIIIILAFLIALRSKRTIYLHVTLLSVFLFIFTCIYQNFTNRTKNELIIYNNSDNATMELIHGKLNYIISEKEIDGNDQIKRTIEQTTQKRQLLHPQFFTLNDSIVNQNLYSKNGIIYFEGKTILFGGPIQNNKIVTPDLIINPSKANNRSLITKNQDIIITNKSYIQNFEENKTAHHYTTFETAFRKIW